MNLLCKIKPTIILAYQWYYKNGDQSILHREDGPAVEYNNGIKFWYLHGKRHRADGPAVDIADSFKSKDYSIFQNSIFNQYQEDMYFYMGKRYFVKNTKEFMNAYRYEQF